MMYDDEYNLAHPLNAEIIVTWIFGIALVGSLLVIISLAT